MLASVHLKKDKEETCVSVKSLLVLRIILVQFHQIGNCVFELWSQNARAEALANQNQ